MAKQSKTEKPKEGENAGNSPANPDPAGGANVALDGAATDPQTGAQEAGAADDAAAQQPSAETETTASDETGEGDAAGDPTGDPPENADTEALPDTGGYVRPRDLRG